MYHVSIKKPNKRKALPFLMVFVFQDEASGDDVVQPLLLLGECDHEIPDTQYE